MIRKAPIPRESAKQKALRGVRPSYSTITARAPMKKVNPERKAKRRVRQAAMHRAYMRSETRKIVDARADGQCEAIVGGDSNTIRVPPRDLLALPRVPYQPFAPRCEHAAKGHHHLTYARYGGDELPSDILKVCRRCHDFLESLHPARNRNYR